MAELFHNAIPSLPDLRIVARIMARQPYPFPKKDFRGTGYLAGEFPSGVTSVDGTPVSAEVRVLWRDPSGSDSDGCLVKTVQSAPDGTWRVDGVNANLKYDVVGRKEGYNDVIVSNVMPTSMVEITYTGEVLPNGAFTGATGHLELVGGIPPYTASVVDPLPAGIFPVVNGRQLIIDGTTTDDDVFNSTVLVTSSNGATKTVPINLVVGFKAPANFKAKTLEDAGAFSVLLTWEVTNTTQEVLVFRSTTPFDLESLPAPIATLTGNAVSYTDDDVVEDDVFYYMTASVHESYTLYSDGVRRVVILDDPHWDNVVSLLHFDGDFADGTDKVWSLGGSPSINNTTYKFGTGSGFFNGTSIESQASADWAFGVGDFTVECWVYATAMPTGLYFSPTGNWISSTGGCFFLRPSGVISWHSGISNYASTNNIISVNTWHHISYSRESGIGRLFVDGIQVASGADTTNFTWTQAFRVGANRTSSDWWRGYVDEFRVTKGVARYTANFTPPTKPFPDK